MAAFGNAILKHPAAFGEWREEDVCLVENAHERGDMCAHFTPERKMEREIVDNVVQVQIGLAFTEFMKLHRLSKILVLSPEVTHPKHQLASSRSAVPGRGAAARDERPVPVEKGHAQ